MKVYTNLNLALSTTALSRPIKTLVIIGSEKQFTS